MNLPPLRVLSFGHFCVLTIVVYLALACGGGGSGGSSSDAMSSITTEGSSLIVSPSTTVQKPSYEIAGQVLDLQDAGLKQVTVTSSSNASTTTQQDGSFRLSVFAGEHQLTFSRAGFTTAYAKIFIGSSLPAGSDAMLYQPGSHSTPTGATLVDGVISVRLKPSQTLSLGATTSITLGKAGQAVEHRQVFSATESKMFGQVRSKAGTPVDRHKYAGATLDFSKLDPTTDLSAMPGPLNAVDNSFAQQKARFKGRQKATEGSEQVGLESVTMMDLTLRDSSGNAIQLSNGDILDTYIKLPTRDQQFYLDKYNNAERMIPWYSFDPAKNTWVREGEAELIKVNGEMYALGGVSHFSWWNLDYPLERGRIQGVVTDDQGNPVSGVQVELKAIGNSFSNQARTSSSGEYSFFVLRNSKVSLTAKMGVLSGTTLIVDIDNTPDTTPHVVNLVFTPHLIKGVVRDQNSSPLSGALVSQKNGVGVYSDASGAYSMKISEESPTLKYQVTLNGLNFLAKASTKANLSANVTLLDAVIDTGSSLHLTGQVRNNGVGIDGAIVYTLNGEQAVTDPDGIYSLLVSQTASAAQNSTGLKLKAYFYDAIQQRYPELEVTLSLQNQATEVVQNFSFSDAEQVELQGRVLVDQKPMLGVEVVAGSGQVSITDENGFYSFKGYVGETLNLKTRYPDRSGLHIQKSLDVTLFSSASGLISAEDIEFTLPMATITGNVLLKMNDGTLSPMGGVRVLSAGGVKRQTSTTGAFRMVVAPEKTFKLWFEVDSPNGLISQEKVIEALPINASQTVDVIFEQSTISNLMPQMTSMSLNRYKTSIGGNVMLELTALDIDGGADTTLSIQGISGDLNLGDVTEVFSHSFVSTEGRTSQANLLFTAQQNIGWVGLSLAITDGVNTFNKVLNLEVLEQIVNHPPVLLALQAPKSVAKDGSYDVACLARDAEGQPLQYGFSVTPDLGVQLVTVSENIVNINGLETLELAPHRRTLVLNGASLDQVYTLTTTISDGEHSRVQSTTFSVQNEAPIFKSVTPNLKVINYDHVGIKFKVHAIDPEGLPLTTSWSVSTDATTYTATEIGERFTFIPSNHLPASANTQKVWIKVSADDGATATDKVVELSITPKGADIVVEPVDLNITWNQGVDLAYGGSSLFTATLIYSNGDEEDVTANVKASGYDPDVLFVSSSNVTGTQEGTHDLSLSFDSNGLSFIKTSSIKVKPARLSRIEAWLSRLTMVVGETMDVLVQAIFEDEQKIEVTSHANTFMSSSNPEVADLTSSVNSSKITAYNAGATTVTISHVDDRYQDFAETSAAITVVSVAVEYLRVYPSNYNMLVGDRLTLSANVIYNDGSEKAVTGLDTTSSDPEIAFGTRDDFIFAMGAGATALSHEYQENGVTVTTSSSIQVTLPEPKLIRIQAKPEDFEVWEGKSQVVEFFGVYNTGVIEKLDPSTAVLSAPIGEFSGNVFSSSDLGKAQLTLKQGELESTVNIKVVSEPSDIEITLLREVGTKAYQVEGTRRKMGTSSTNLIFYSDQRNLNSMLVNDPSNLTRLDRLPLNGYAHDMLLNDRRLHISLGYYGYRLINVENPSAMSLPTGSSFRGDGVFHHLENFSVGKQKYVALTSREYRRIGGAQGFPGVVVLDVTNPRNIVRVARIVVEGQAKSLSYMNGKLYLTMGETYGFNFDTMRWGSNDKESLVVIDVARADDPKITESHEVELRPTSRDRLGVALATENGLLLHRTSSSKLELHPLADMNLDKSLSTLANTSNVWNIQEDHEGFLISNLNYGVTRVTIGGNLTEPTLEKTFNLVPPRPEWQPQEDVTSSGNEASKQEYRPNVLDAVSIAGTIYHANGYNGLGVVHESEDRFGESEAGLPNFSYVSDLHYVDHKIFVASSREGIKVFDVNESGEISLLNIYSDESYNISKMCYDTQQNIFYVSKYSRYSYWWHSYYGAELGDTPHRLEALSWNDEENKFDVVADLAHQGWIQQLQAFDGGVMAATRDFGYYSWSNPSRLQKFTLSGNTLALDAQREFDPVTMKWGSYSYIYDITMNEGYIAVASYNGGVVLLDHDMNLVKALNVNELKGKRRGVPNFSQINQVMFLDQHTLVLGQWGSSWIVDLENLDEIKLLSYLSYDLTRASAYQNGLLLSPSYWQGTSGVINLQDHLAPERILIDNFEVPDYSQVAAWQGTRALIGSGWSGFNLYHVHLPEKFKALKPIVTIQVPSKVAHTANVLLTSDGTSDVMGLGLNYQWDLVDSPYQYMLNDNDDVVLNHGDQESLFSNQDASPHLTGLPSGSHWVQLTVDNGQRKESTRSPIQVNFVPTLSVTPDVQDLKISSSSPYEFLYEAEDTDGDAFITKVDVLNNPNSQITTSDNMVSVTPIQGDQFTLRFSASDNLDETIHQTNIVVNQRPVLSVKSYLTGDQHNELVIDASASSDPDGDELLVALTELSAGNLNLENVNSAFIYRGLVSSTNSVQQSSFLLSLMDEHDTVTATLDLANINRSPSIGFSDNIYMTTSSNHLFDSQTFDLDGDSLTASWQSLSGNHLTFEPLGASVMLTSDNGVGSTFIKLSVSDNISMSQRTFEVITHSPLLVNVSADARYPTAYPIVITPEISSSLPLQTVTWSKLSGQSNVQFDTQGVLTIDSPIANDQIVLELTVADRFQTITRQVNFVTDQTPTFDLPQLTEVPANTALNIDPNIQFTTGSQPLITWSTSANVDLVIASDHLTATASVGAAGEYWVEFDVAVPSYQLSRRQTIVAKGLSVLVIPSIDRLSARDQYTFPIAYQLTSDLSRTSLSANLISGIGNVQLYQGHVFLSGNAGEVLEVEFVSHDGLQLNTQNLSVRVNHPPVIDAPIIDPSIILSGPMTSVMSASSSIANVAWNASANTISLGVPTSDLDSDILNYQYEYFDGHQTVTTAENSHFDVTIPSTGNSLRWSLTVNDGWDQTRHDFEVEVAVPTVDPLTLNLPYTYVRKFDFDISTPIIYGTWNGNLSRLTELNASANQTQYLIEELNPLTASPDRGSTEIIFEGSVFLSPYENFKLSDHTFNIGDGFYNNLYSNENGSFSLVSLNGMVNPEYHVNGNIYFIDKYQQTDKLYSRSSFDGGFQNGSQSFDSNENYVVSSDQDNIYLNELTATGNGILRFDRLAYSESLTFLGSSNVNFQVNDNGVLTGNNISSFDFDVLSSGEKIVLSISYYHFIGVYTFDANLTLLSSWSEIHESIFSGNATPIISEPEPIPGLVPVPVEDLNASGIDQYNPHLHLLSNGNVIIQNDTFSPAIFSGEKSIRLISIPDGIVFNLTNRVNLLNTQNIIHSIFDPYTENSIIISEHGLNFIKSIFANASTHMIHYSQDELLSPIPRPTALAQEINPLALSIDSLYWEPNLTSGSNLELTVSVSNAYLTDTLINIFSEADPSTELDVAFDPFPYDIDINAGKFDDFRLHFNLTESGIVNGDMLILEMRYGLQVSRRRIIVDGLP